MPKDWPAQPRFLEVLKSMRVASRPKLAELEALAVEDARSFYKHAVAILTKQIQARKPRHRVAVLYVINALVTHQADAETAKLYAGRFAPEVRACVAAALECPPEHVSGVRRVLKRWRRRACFSASVLDDAAALVEAHRREGGTDSREPKRGGSEHRETSVQAEEKDAEKEEEYVLSEADDDDDDAVRERDSGGVAGSAKPSDATRRETPSGGPDLAPAPFKPSLDFAKSRVNRWPTKKPNAAKPETEIRSPPLTAAATAANPPPPVPGANPPPPSGAAFETAKERNHPPRAAYVSPSPPKKRSPRAADDARGGIARRRDEGELNVSRRSRDGSRDRRPRDSNPHNSAVRNGGRGGASGRVPVDKWGDPIRREGNSGGGRVSHKGDLKREREVRDGGVFDGDGRRGAKRDGDGALLVAARGARGRSRSRSRERVRSPVR